LAVLRSDDAGHRAEHPVELLAVRRIQLDAERVADLGEEPLDRRRDVQRELVAAQPGHRLAQLRDGVVLRQHRAVAGGALGGQPDPGHALLSGLDHVQPGVVVDAQAEAADLADRLGAALEQLRLVGHQPLGPVDAAGLLVGDERQHHVARGLAAGAHPVPDDRQHHGVHVLHVDRSAAPHAPVGNLRRERVVGPLLGLGRHDVEVAVDQQRVASRVGALHAGDHARTTWCGLVQLRIEADLGQLLRDVLRGRPLAGPPARPVVDGRETDQVAAEVDDLVLGVRHRGSSRRGPNGSGPALRVRDPTACNS
jgi:hypothetical protein